MEGLPSPRFGKTAGQQAASRHDRPVFEQPDRQQASQQGDACLRQGLASGSRPGVCGRLLFVAAKEHHRHRRRERQRVEGGDHGARRNREGKLLVKLPADARDKRRRHKHAHQGQRRGDQGPRDLTHRLPRGLPRGEPLREPPLDVLHHHNRVVDDDADRQHEAKQREVVEGEAEAGHHRERADERNRHSEHWDQRGPPVLQEDQHHEKHEHDRFEERLDHLLHALLHKHRGVVVDRVAEALGEVAGKRGHLAVDCLGGGHRVGAGQLEDGDRDGGLTVEPAGHLLVFGAKLHPADVANPHDAGGTGGPFTAAALPGLHDHLGKLFGRRQPPGGVDRQLKVDHADGRLAAESPCGHLHVLLAKRSHHIASGEAAGGELVGVEPDPHRVVAAAEKAHVAHARNPGEGILHL